MDLVAACRSFVSVAERGSFTLGAARIGVDQSVASRRVAALERHLDGQVLDRSARRPALTPLGRRLLPTARRLLEVADLLELEAEDDRLSELTLAVPLGWSVRDLAALVLAAGDHGVRLVLREAPPAARADLVATGQVTAGLLARPPDEATWRVPLGLAGATVSARGIHLDQLRRGRVDGAGARVWLLAEDDVPHVRDRLVAAAEAAGLALAQVAVARSVHEAVAAVLASRDLLLVGAREARDLDLPWARLRGLTLTRGYAVGAARPADTARLVAAVGDELARALGSDVETGR